MLVGGSLDRTRSAGESLCKATLTSCWWSLHIWYTDMIYSNLALSKKAKQVIRVFLTDLVYISMLRNQCKNFHPSLLHLVLLPSAPPSTEAGPRSPSPRLAVPEMGPQCVAPTGQSTLGLRQLQQRLAEGWEPGTSCMIFHGSGLRHLKGRAEQPAGMLYLLQFSDIFSNKAATKAHLCTTFVCSNWTRQWQHEAA